MSVETSDPVGDTDADRAAEPTVGGAGADPTSPGSRDASPASEGAGAGADGAAAESSAGHSRLRKLAVSALKLGVSAAAVGLVASQVDTGELMAVLAKADVSRFALVMVLYLLGQALTAYRWHFIAQRVGFDHGLREVTLYYFIGMFFNLFGPSTLGGDVVRSLYLGQRDGRRMVALNTVIFDRLSGLVMLVVLAMLAMAVFGTFGLPELLVWATVVGALTLVVGWWLLPPVVRAVFPESSRPVRIVRDVAPFWRDRSLLAQAAWVSLGFHCLQAGSLILLGQAVGMDIDWRYYFVFHPLVTVLSAAPVSVAGLGIREMGYLWFLERVAVSTDVAVAFGVLWFAVLTLSGLVGGLVYLAAGVGLPPVRARR